MADPALGVTDPEAGTRDLWARRVLITLVTAIIVLGAFGRLGVRSGTQEATAASGRVELTYAKVARPGLAVPWRLRIDELDATRPHVLSVELSTSYADSFDFNNVTPEPNAVTRDPDTITYEFGLDSTSSFEMAFDSRVEPAVQWRRSGDVVVELDGNQLARLDITTWILP